MITHDQLITALWKPGQQIVLSEIQRELLHAAIGISGESGELLDAIKKHCIYSKSIDYPNVIEELGDIEFFLGALRKILNITREQCIEANIKKLGVRYPGGIYSDEHAQARLDKANE